MSTTSDYEVTGLTCGHCVASVTDEVGSVEGVQGVDIDLNPGGLSRLTVTSEHPVSIRQVHQAVREAGYELTGMS